MHFRLGYSPPAGTRIHTVAVAEATIRVNVERIVAAVVEVRRAKAYFLGVKYISAGIPKYSMVVDVTITVRITRTVVVDADVVDVRRDKIKI